MASIETYQIGTVRTGITEDGKLELQLVYGNNRGSTIWFHLTRAQAMKLAREIEAMRETEVVYRPPIKLAAGE